MYSSHSRLRAVSVGSLAFGALGGALCWWLPFGIVFSMAGLLLGFIDYVSARRRSLEHRLAVVGIAISLVSLAAGFIVLALGMQLVTFGGPG